MSANFDWQTEDESNRDQSGWDVPPEPAPPPPTGWKARWRLIAAFVVLAAAAGGLVWWRVDQQIDANLQAIRNDVASSYNLLQSAAANGDEELFRSVLSGRDATWTTAALALFNDGLLTDRRQLGLRASDGSLPLTLPVPVEEAAADETVADFSFSPDLSEATVLTWHPYVYEDGSGTQKTAQLLQTAVFRMGGQRWLFSPPTVEFWGETESAETDRLTVVYPERDRDIALQLVDDLDALLVRACDTLADLKCDESFRLDIRLDTEPNSLVALTDPVAVFAQPDDPAVDLNLPAPTLVGLPATTDTGQSNPGYEALLQAYAIPVVQRALVDRTGWTCCDQQFLFQVLADYQLSELGLRAWPLAAADWDRVLADRLELSDINGMWRRSSPPAGPEEDRWQLYAVMEFLLEAIAPDSSAAQLQRLLPISPNMSEWVARIDAGKSASTDPSWVLDSLDEAWWIYGLQGSVGDELTTWPESDESLYIACTVSEEDRMPDPSRAYRFDQETTQWEPVYEMDGFIWMAPLPDPSALLTQEFVIDGERWHTSVWQDGERIPMHGTDNGFNFSFAESDPTGRYVISYEWDPMVDRQQALLLDLNDCDETGCAAQTLPGLPIWSPDGSHAIVTGNGNTLPDSTIFTHDRVIIFDTADRLSEEFLSLGSGPAIDPDEERLALGRGYAPFWIDETTFGYIDVVFDELGGPTLEQQVVVATLDDPTPQPLVSSVDLRAPLPVLATPSNLTLAYAVSDPTDANILYIAGLHERSQVAYLFRYDIAEDEATVMLEANYELNHSFSISPNGRHVVLTGRDPAVADTNSSNGLLYLYDLTDTSTIPFKMQLPFFLTASSYDWTNDGQWLTMAMDDGLVALVNTADQTVRTLPHELGNCTSAVWVNEGMPEASGR